MRWKLIFTAMFAILINNQLANAKVTIAGGAALSNSNNTDYMTNIRYLTVPVASRPGTFATMTRAQSEALEDATCRAIFDAMASSNTETFDFATKDVGADHFKMRCKIIDYMDKMNNGTIDFKYYNPKHKKPNGDPDPIPVTPPAGGRWQKGASTPYWFELTGVAGNNPYDAIQDAIAANGGTKSECSCAITVCIFAGACDALGKTAFNAVHAAPEVFKLGYQGSDDKHLYIATDTDVLIPGDFVYWKNADDYKSRWKDKGGSGFWQGENCVYMGKSGGDPVYSGLGASRRTGQQMKDKLIETYELELLPKNEHMTDAMKATVKLDKTAIWRIKLGN